jgi:hypothetical protein
LARASSNVCGWRNEVSPATSVELEVGQPHDECEVDRCGVAGHVAGGGQVDLERAAEPHAVHRQDGAQLALSLGEVAGGGAGELAELLAAELRLREAAGERQVEVAQRRHRPAAAERRGAEGLLDRLELLDLAGGVGERDVGE